MRLNCVVLMCSVCIILLPFAGFCDETATIYTTQVEQLRKSATAGDALAQLNLGTLYIHGLGVKEDDAEAEKWFLKAAEQGYAPAQATLGSLYGTSFNTGIERDDAKAMKWLLKAAEQGDTLAQTIIGELYDSKGNDAEAMKWFLKAAEQGNVKSQFLIGMLYDYGKGVKQDRVEAMKLYLKAAEQGHVLSQYFVGVGYDSDIVGIKKDKDMAKEWLKKACDNGFKRGCDKFSILAAETRGVTVATNPATGQSGKVEEQADRKTERSLAGEFVTVPEGCFQMGDTIGGGQYNEKPVHEVCLSPFRIGTYDVTQGQYQKIMDSNPSSFKQCGDNCPVENVSWNDAQAFISRLNSLTGKHYRLPTETEWEYACRSGGKNERYCGGSDIDALAWYSGNSGYTTHPVGQKQPNGLGIYDMSGNVWQWVQDWYGSYSSGRQQDPAGPSSGTYRVFRGGCWVGGPAGVRAAIRSVGGPGGRGSTMGFRLASPVQ